MEPQAPHLVYILNDCDFFVSHRLAHAIAAKNYGYRVSVICPTADSTKQILKAGVTHIPWQLESTGTHLFKEMQSLFALKRLMQRAKADIFHSVSFKANLYSGILVRFFLQRKKPIPIVFAISGMGSSLRVEQMHSGLTSWLVKLAYKLIFSHKYAEAIVQNKVHLEFITQLIPEHRCHLIRGVGVDMSQISNRKRQPNETEPLHFAMISRLVEDKGVIDYLKAANEVLKSHPHTQFSLWGFFYKKQNMLTMESIEPYLNENIVFKGFCENTIETLLNTDVLVLPTRANEGVPKILIDAQAAGCGIITTDIPGCLEIVEDEKTGLIVPCHQIKAIVSAMNRLIKDRGLLNQISTHAKQKAVKEHDVFQITQQIMKIHNDLLQTTNTN